MTVPGEPTPAERPDARWMVRFRSCNIWWAADHEHVTDYAPLWDQVPWNDRLTESLHTDEAAARDQYETLRRWETDRSQPVKDVELLTAQQPDWTPAVSR